MIQGSRRMWKGGGGGVGDDGDGKAEGRMVGVKVSWKEASVLRCLIVRAMGRKGFFFSFSFTRRGS